MADPIGGTKGSVANLPGDGFYVNCLPRCRSAAHSRGAGVPKRSDLITVGIGTKIDAAAGLHPHSCAAVLSSTLWAAWENVTR